MPIYEYSCKQCDSAFELLIRDSDHPVCPGCGNEQVEKLLSVPVAHSARSSGRSPIGEGFAPGPCGMGGCGRPECEID